MDTGSAPATPEAAMLTAHEKERYDRQLRIPQVGEGGQVRLKQAKILIAGAGGLGAPAAYYLAAAGIGHIRIVDRDRVDLSNLNRQLLHWEKDIGRDKSESAKEKLSRLNPDVTVETVTSHINEDTISALAANFDGIIDALDNFTGRYVLNKAAATFRIPFFHGAVQGFEGRATTILPGKTACLACMPRGESGKAANPIIGITPGVIGCIQAAECIKYLLEQGQLLENRMIVYDGLEMTWKEFTLKTNPQCPVCGAANRNRHQKGSVP